MRDVTERIALPVAYADDRVAVYLAEHAALSEAMRAGGVVADAMIPNAVLGRCEWGRDDYSLNVRDDAPAADHGAAEPAPTTGKGMAKRPRRERSYR